MEWTQYIGPALMLALGALMKWAGDTARSAWDARQRARLRRESRWDLVHRSRRVLIDEIGRLRALLRRHGVPEDDIGPMVDDPWDDKENGDG